MIRKQQSYNKFIVALILVASLASSSLISPLVSAVSVYDNAYQQTESLEIRGKGYGQDCGTEDITSSWNAKLLADPSVGDSFSNALDSGSWAIGQTKADNGMAGVHDDFVRIYWTESTEMELNFQHMFSTFYETRLVKSDANQPIHQALIRSNFTGSVGGQNCDIIVQDAGTSNDVQFTDNFTMAQASREVRGYLAVGVNVNYPDDYEGDVVASGSMDEDEDGLSFAQESAQGTLDSGKDTDGDGLSDYTESQWYPNRQSIFCDTSCAYPNPLQKDLYIEIDWMKDSSRVMKPSATQLAKVEEAFTDQDIVVHFDAGQYGGGNELPTYTQDLSFYRTDTATDFYDYKYGNSSITANFDTDRYKIWHYVITGYRYTQNLDSSGASYVGDDDTFISLGKLEDDQGSSADNAIAGTLLHELGHSVCLSDTQQYPTQPTGCVYAGIDTEDDPVYSSYHSVMNYDYQFSSLVDLSNGTGTPEDHDDWGAVAEGMGDFVNSDAEGENPDNQNFMSPNSRTFAPRVIRHITH